MRRISFELSILLFLFPLIGFSENNEVDVKATIETREALIGDQIYYNLEVKSSNNKINIIFPSLLDTLGEFSIAKSEPMDTLSNNGDVVVSKKYYITVFDSGDYTIPPLSFAYSNPDDPDNFRFKKTNPISVRINTMPIDTAKGFVDIKGNYDAEFSIYEILDYILYSIGIILLIAIAYYIYKKYFYKEKVEEENIIYDPKIPPHILAEQSLKALQEKRLWQQNQIKQYHTELTDIIRIYLERVTDIQSLELTSDETLAEFERVCSNEELNEGLRFMLSTADLAKFAKQQPLPDENTRSMEEALKFISIAKTIFQTLNVEEENGRD